ncbi:hypothetical protein [Methylobacillus sp.]|uniref:hypothetical protein n=1 Tax=Methylobacillus sp. TaxID=56818 RepID=UPI00257C871E|nr:hypothetical protein [Methylobacillus sp.]
MTAVLQKFLSKISTQMPVKAEMLPIDDFLEIENCPVQRDTERNLARGLEQGRFKNLHVTHLNIHLGEFPDGKRMVLDGHTRQYGWGSGLMKRPDMVLATIYPVQNVEEAKDLYYTFNHKACSETNVDIAFGLAREIGIDFKSAVMRRGSYVSAMQAATSEAYANNRPAMTEKFREPLIFLDTLNPIASRGFSAGVMAAVLVTYAKYPDIAKSFWESYVSDSHGGNSGTQADGVHALWARVAQRRADNALGGGSNVKRVMEESLHAFEKYRNGSLFNMPVGRFCTLTLSDFIAR